MMIGFMIMMILLVIVAGSYLYYHIYKVINVEKHKRRVSLIILSGVLLCCFLSEWILGFIIHLLIIFVIVDIIDLIVKKTPIRKYFRAEIIAVVIANLLTGYGIYNVNHMQYIQYDVYVDKEFEDKRILAISDLHLSTAVHYEDLKQIKDKVKKRDIDMIFILGDLFDEGTDKNEAKKAVSFFEELTNECPVYYIVGNHDGSQGQVPVDEGLLKLIDESRIHFLKDEVINVQGLNIVGRLDRTYQRKDVKTIIEGIDQEDPIILLDHQPKETKENASLGIDLQLSGHTHNGQIWPLGTLCKIFHINEVEYGHVNIDGMDVIVSSGMGTWGLAMKSQGNCEILEINLKQK